MYSAMKTQEGHCNMSTRKENILPEIFSKTQGPGNVTLIEAMDLKSHQSSSVVRPRRSASDDSGGIEEISCKCREFNVLSTLWWIGQAHFQ